MAPKSRQNHWPAVLALLVPGLLILAGAFSGTDALRPPDEMGPPPALGVTSHVLWSGQSERERLATLDKVAESGVGWVRLDVGWCTLEEHGRGDLSDWYVERVEQMVDAARERGLRVLATLWCTPEWANGGQPRNVPPDDPAEYARIARIMAHRLRGRVAGWQIWNEPNANSFWAGADAGEYTRLLRVGYRAIKGADPDALVVFGGLVYNDAEWLEEAYAAGAKGSFDILATHPYMGRGDDPPEHRDLGRHWTLVAVTRVREVMLDHGDDRPIWFTEFGWSVHSNTGREPAWERGVSEEEQAEYLVRAVEMVTLRYPYVDVMFWYNDRAKATSDRHQSGYGLLTRDLQPRPAYHALSALSAGEGWQQGSPRSVAPSRSTSEEPLGSRPTRPQSSPAVRS